MPPRKKKRAISGYLCLRVFACSLPLKCIAKELRSLWPICGTIGNLRNNQALVTSIYYCLLGEKKIRKKILGTCCDIIWSLRQAQRRLIRNTSSGDAISSADMPEYEGYQHLLLLHSPWVCRVLCHATRDTNAVLLSQATLDSLVWHNSGSFSCR